MKQLWPVAECYCLQMSSRRRRRRLEEGTDTDFPVEDWFIQLPVERLREI